MTFLIALTPRLEVRREFIVGYDVDRVQIGNAGKIVRQPFDDRLAADYEQRFRFVQRQWIKASCVSRSENQNVHETKTIRSKARKRSCFRYGFVEPHRIVSFKCC